mmetsp:Transcript_4250/g.8135  ORF Transcript_4250/g.8135 Transcript_4250/m.8135 type:complete len:241 (-) Transcript_4250:16-738(-)
MSLPKSRFCWVILQFYLIISDAYGFLLLPTTNAVTKQFQLVASSSFSGTTITITTTKQQRRFHYVPVVLADANQQITESTSNGQQSFVDEIISEMHKSGYKFRIIVIGNHAGAILETTSILGPIMKSSVSPKSGQRLVTLASQDQSFEFHINVDQVHEVVFVEKNVKILDNKNSNTTCSDENGGGEHTKIMRICRFLNQGGDSICSLILSEGNSSDRQEIAEWFARMTKCYSGKTRKQDY